MRIKYNKNEFVVNDIEIREIKCSPNWENNDSYFTGYEIEYLEAYRNGEQIDVEDENIITDKLWEIITKMLNEQIEEKEAIDF